MMFFVLGRDALGMDRAEPWEVSLEEVLLAGAGIDKNALVKTTPYR